MRLTSPRWWRLRAQPCGRLLLFSVHVSWGVGGLEGREGDGDEGETSASLWADGVMVEWCLRASRARRRNSLLRLHMVFFVLFFFRSTKARNTRRLRAGESCGRLKSTFARTLLDTSVDHRLAHWRVITLTCHVRGSRRCCIRDESTSLCVLCCRAKISLGVLMPRRLL